jgi:GT2 family glycosyltransferase
VRFALPTVHPRVTIIIPTRNQLGMLRRCVSSILERTRYDQYDLVIVDNGSDDPQCLQWLTHIGEQPRVRVRRDDQPFNFSSLNNAAVSEARGEFVALLNNDVEVISPDWLEEMLSLAARPEIGAVGARLLYGDRTLQHGGVILGLQGGAGHVLKRLASADAGPGGRARLLQSYLAVTAACLVVRRALYEQVGGMDEATFAVAFNDVDFCLKLHAAGYRNLWTPYAELFHHESISRGKEAVAARRQRLELERAALRARWPRWIEHDPHYNPNLTLKSDDFALAEPPREPLLTSS